MSDVPPLPDTDDPFELLGVSRDVDETGLKRAYVALLKVYRPDRDPASFQRVQRAYEEAQVLLSFSQLTGGLDMLSPGDAEGTFVEDEVFQAIRSAWSAFRDGDRDAALKTLAECHLENPFAAVVAAHRTLLAEALGEPGSCVHLVRSLHMGAPVAGWIADLFTSEELRDIAQDDQLLWTYLRKGEDRFGAARILRARWHGMVQRGQGDRVLLEIEDPEFADDALTDPHLGLLVRELAAVLAWEAPKRALRLAEMYAGDASDTVWGVDYDALVQMVADVAQHADVRRWVRTVPALFQHLQFHGVLDADEIAPIARALGEAVVADPDAHAYVLALLTLHSPIFVSHYAGSIEAMEPGRPRQERARDAALDESMRLLDRRVHKDSGYQARSMLYGGALLLSIGSFFWVGWWGIAVVLGVLVLGGWIYVRYSNRYYVMALRQGVVRVVTRHVIQPEDVVAWIRRNKRSIEDLGSFETDIEEDFVLDVVYWIARLRYLDPDKN